MAIPSYNPSRKWNTYHAIVALAQMLTNTVYVQIFKDVIFAVFAGNLSSTKIKSLKFFKQSLSGAQWLITNDP